MLSSEVTSFAKSGGFHSSRQAIKVIRTKWQDLWLDNRAKLLLAALALSLPTLAAVVSFLCYIGIGNTLNPARLFTALSLFQLLRQPLMFLPRALSASADAWNALTRLQEVFEAETRGESVLVDPNLDIAMRSVNASFQWLTTDPDDLSVSPKKKKQKNKNKEKIDPEVVHARDPFKVVGLNMEIKRGQLVAIVGGVGCGKSSILAGLIGEMKALAGEVRFGGRIAYCSQGAFIQNATLRDNILFGQPWDEERYWRVLEDACLIPDCIQLPDGDLTEVREDCTVLR